MTVIRDPAKASALAQELSALLAKGGIEPVDPQLQAGGFYLAYFLVDKKDSGFQPILDLRGLNTFLKVLPFHMLTSADTLRVVARGEWFTTIELEAAYFHVPVASHHRRFLKFAYRGRHFQFTVLPFALSLSPRVFARVVAAALAPLQMQGMKVLPYLDDWLVCAPSRYQVAQDTARLLSHMARLGLTVNWGKSCLDPSQRVTYLGIVMDSVAMRACLSPRRMDDILGMGRSVAGQDCAGMVVCPRGYTAYQRARASPGISEPVDLGVSPSGQPAGSLFTGGQESGRGLPLPMEAPTGRMAASSRGGGLNVGPLRQGGGRPLCLGGVDALPPLDRSDQPVGAGRVGTRLAGQTSVCLSTIASDPTDTPEGPFAGPPASAGGSLLAREALVPAAAQTLLQCAMAPPRQGPPVTAEGSDLASRPLSLQGPTHC